MPYLELNLNHRIIYLLVFCIFLFIFFSSRPSPGLLPVLGPLGSGTDATCQPSPAVRLLGYLEKTYTITAREPSIYMSMNVQMYLQMYQSSLHNFGPRINSPE